MLETESSACPLCHERRSRPRFEEAGWHYVQCRCGLIRLDPRPTGADLERFYQSYLPTEGSGLGDWERMMAGVFSCHGEWIGKLSAPGRILDIGCGQGFFLQEMNDAGWDAVGVDLSKGAVELARSRGLDARRGGVEDLDAAPGSFDVITAFYVIEHHPDPPALVSRARELLRPGGWLLLRWPNTTPIARWVHPLIGDRWRLFQAPAHLYDFAPKTMVRLIEEQGLEVVEHRHAGHTVPANIWQRVVSSVFTGVSNTMSAIGGGLLPGVSRTTLARRR